MHIEKQMCNCSQGAGSSCQGAGKTGPVFFAPCTLTTVPCKQLQVFIYKILNVTIIPMSPEVLEVIKKVHELFKEKGVTLSVAESCTGGLISHYLTTLPGASSFFVAGITSYAESAKKDILGVSPDAILRHGVVSGEVAKEMAERVCLLAKTEFSISTTGNLGPDVLEGKEKGLVYIAASKAGKTVLRELRLKGGREENKEDAALSALRLLIEFAQGQ